MDSIHIQVLSHKLGFDNLTPISSNSIQSEKKEQKGFLGKVEGFFNKAKNKVEDTVKKVGDKIKDMEIGDKIKTTGAKTIEVVKTTGTYVVEKGKEAYVFKNNLEI